MPNISRGALIAGFGQAAPHTPGAGVLLTVSLGAEPG